MKPEYSQNYLKICVKWLEYANNLNHHQFLLQFLQHMICVSLDISIEMSPLAGNEYQSAEGGRTGEEGDLLVFFDVSADLFGC